MTRAWGRRVTAVAAVLLLAAACTLARPSRPAFHPQLAWTQCPSDVELQFLSQHRCGWLTVLQDRAKPTGKTVRLLVVQSWPVGVAPLPGVGVGFGTTSAMATATAAPPLERPGCGASTSHWSYAAPDTPSPRWPVRRSARWTATTPCAAATPHS